MTKILVIEDEEALRANLLDLLEAEGFDGLGASDGATGLALAFAERPDLIVCDIRMRPIDGHEVLRALRAHPDTAAVPFLFLSAAASRADVRAGMNLGADDYLTKPFTRVELLEAVRTRLARRSVLAEAATLGPAARPLERAWPTPPPSPFERDLPAGVVLRSRAAQAVFEQARRAAEQGSIGILILGETGVGKDVLARAIHGWSPRAGGPFLALNCGALPEALLESELFGHEKGSFTGAAQARPGLFEAASGGTVFLDEIGELPLAAQVRLLRVLEDRQVLRIGSRVARTVDVRFVAATNRDLEAEAARGAFRRDLFFRIHGLSLTVPPLRERTEEIEPLARTFLAEESHKANLAGVPSLSPEVLSLLQGYDWPGNVRELRHVIERAVVLCAGATLLPSHLPEKLVERAGGSVPSPAARRALGGPARPPREAADEGTERQRTLDALERCGGNQTQAAELLGISRRTLVYRLSAYGLTRPRRRLEAVGEPGEDDDKKG